MNDAPAPINPRTQPGTTAPLPGALNFVAHLTSILIPFLLHINARSPLLGAYFLPLHARIARAYRRLVILFTRLAAGKLPRAHTPRPGAKAGPPAIRFPSGPAWLVGILGYHAAGYASQLQHLLHDPAALAILAAAPPAALKAAGRTLRPLCRLLGVPLPPALQPVAKPPTPRFPRPKPARLPPLLPLYPQRRPRLILYPNPPRTKKPA